MRGIPLYHVVQTFQGEKSFIPCGSMLADGSQSITTVDYYRAQRVVKEMQEKNPEKSYELVYGDILVT